MQPEKQPNPQQETEQEKRERLIANHIENNVLGNNESLDEETEQEIKKYYSEMSIREKTDTLYEKLMAYTVDKRAETAQKKSGKETEVDQIDPYLISEIKVLYSEPEVQQEFPAKYAEARTESKKVRTSEMGRLWQNNQAELEKKEKLFQQTERYLHLDQIKSRSGSSSAKSKLAILAKNLSSLRKRQANITALEGYPKVAENTDMAAAFNYDQLKNYREQIKEGFVWLPSRKRIHEQTVSAILNHRWPVLIGEAGSGKSEQADAAAKELTGYLPLEIECESTTGEKQLIVDKDIDPKTGGSYDAYGPLMQAFTGYEDSRQSEPAVKTGRIARFDESGRLGPKAYAIIKKARQKKAGDDFYGRPVLPGAGAIWATNPVGPRYPDRHQLDPAMRRELAEIHVDYPDMSVDKPELYEFAVTALMDENDHIAAAKKELAPNYKKYEIAENQREVLEDGSIVVAEDRIIEDMTDTEHGSLWRFCGAIKSLQDSFVYGNAETEKYPDTLLRFKEDADGQIEITKDGSGEPLTLHSSTVTLGEMASWMTGFNERRQKQDEEFRVDTLTEWLNFKVKTYLQQADKADQEKLKAIFNHFGFLERNVVPNLEGSQPLTPKEIGYLSPRVPRPVYLEQPIQSEEELPQEDEAIAGEAEAYTTRQVLLENGDRVLMQESGYELADGAFDVEKDEMATLSMADGMKLKLAGQDYIFQGIVEDPNSEYNGQPIGKLKEEELYKIFSDQESRRGIIEAFQDSFENDFAELREATQSCWEEECANEPAPEW